MGVIVNMEPEIRNFENIYFMKNTISKKRLQNLKSLNNQNNPITHNWLKINWFNHIYKSLKSI
jgi:hypothetical protein